MTMLINLGWQQRMLWLRTETTLNAILPLIFDIWKYNIYLHGCSVKARIIWTIWIIWIILVDTVREIRATR